MLLHILRGDLRGMGIFNKCYIYAFIYFSALLWSVHSKAGLYDVAKESSFSYEKLQSLINEKEITSVEEALENIKLYYPEFFSNYILMYHSRSLQGSSFKNPRAILFDKSGHFVFTFNGNSKQRGFDKLEVMQFREKTRSFDFHEVTFSKSRRPEFSKANPKKCQVCHQSPDRKNIDMRPNWEPYNIWPGAYGSISGNIKLSTYHKHLKRLRDADPLVLKNASLEEEELHNFFENVYENHSRYKLLNKEEFEPRQTVIFTEIQNTLAQKRVARIITQDLENIYKQISSTLAAGVRCKELMVSESAYKWLKNNWGNEEFKPEPDKYVSSAYVPAPDIFNDRISDQRENYVVAENNILEDEKKFSRVNISELLHHVFEPLGISTSDWSLDFKTNGELAFRQRFGSPSNVQKMIRNAMKESFREEGLLKLNCEELAEKSVKQFDDFMKSETFFKLLNDKDEKVKNKAPLMNRCIKCHESGDIFIPYIPFSNEEDLAKYLKEPSEITGRKLIEDIKYRLGDFVREEDRMPLGPIGSKEERSKLLEYLESLVAK